MRKDIQLNLGNLDMDTDMIISENVNNIMYIETLEVGNPAWLYNYESERIKDLTIVAIEEVNKPMVDYDVCRRFNTNGKTYNVYLTLNKYAARGKVA